MISATHFVATKGHYLAIVSTTVETANPEEEIRVAHAWYCFWINHFYSWLVL
jgi:RAB protein geranylgeranyltransferase component A